MSFDKAKAMRNAERFLAQGKIRAAIGEYQQVIESDRTDFSTLNMLGDLYAKTSEPDEAVACFSQVAEHYSKQGFAQKAIAIYNKISRLKPDSIEVSAKLAHLYQAKGSIAEARLHYTTLAEQYTRKGKKTEALEIWKQIAGLDPNNTDIYYKIADICWQDQQKDEAANAYIEAGRGLNLKKKYESAVTAYSRALEINPDNLQALKGFVESQMNLGYTDEAAKALESSIARQPHNRELMFMLIDCQLEMGNLVEAEHNAVKLVEKEPSNYPKLLDLIQAYLKEDNLESATRILSIASEHLLVGGKAKTLESILTEILNRNPEQLDAVRLLVRLNTWQRDETGIRKSFERLAEAARLSDSVEDERYALEQLVMIAPQNAYFPQRLQELRIAHGFTASGSENSANGNLWGAAPNSESYNVPDGQEKENSPAETDLSESPEYASVDGEAYSFEDNETESATIGTENIITEDADEDNFARGNLSEFELHNLQREIDGIDFYVTQGFTDLAEKSLADLEERFGKHPEIDRVRATLNLPETNSAEELPDESAGEIIDSAAQVRENSAEFEAGEYEPETNGSFAIVEKIADPEETESVGTAAGIDENEKYLIDSETVQSIEDFADYQIETADISESETTTAIGEADLTDSEISEEIKSLSALAEEFAADSPKEEIGTETESLDSSIQTDSQPESADEIASQNAFVEDEEDDFETNYQIGIAYKEMGLIEDAIREFQDAVKLVSVNDGTRRFYWCCNLLGHCFLEKRMPNIALMWFKRALETKNLTEEESQGLRYELANAYEMGGDKQAAIRYFEEIYAFDVDYRDVGKRLEKLMSV